MLLLLARSGQWGGWESLEPAANLVDLAAVVYGMIAVLVERGADMVFWALEQKRRREQEREQRLAELLEQMRAEGRAEGQAEGRAEGQAEGRAEGQAEERARVLRAAKEKGIDIATLFPGEDKE